MSKKKSKPVVEEEHVDGKKPDKIKIHSVIIEVGKKIPEQNSFAVFAKDGVHFLEELSRIGRTSRTLIPHKSWVNGEWKNYKGDVLKAPETKELWLCDLIHMGKFALVCPLYLLKEKPAQD